MGEDSIVYGRGQQGLPWVWEAFFSAHPLVSHVEVFLPCEVVQDVEVYFTDSTEVFPLSSLRRESPVKQALMALLEL